MTRTQNAPPDHLCVYRGGGWYSTNYTMVRATIRYSVAPAFRVNSLGFRVSLPVRQPR